MDVEGLAMRAEEHFGPDRVLTAPTLPDAIETAIALAEEGGDDSDSSGAFPDGFAGSGIVITGSVLTAGAARTLFGRDPA
jgi:dihydrofolate synthase/folylpolyglutamate synthase